MDSFSRAMSHVDSLDLQAKKKGKEPVADGCCNLFWVKV